MKRKNWQILVIVTSLILVTLLLSTACAKQAPAPTPAPSPTSVPAPAPTSVPAKPMKLKFASYPPPSGGTFTDDILYPWGEKLKDLTNGRVNVTFYMGGSLAPAQALYDTVLTGAADMVWTTPEFTPGVFPRSDVWSLPMVFLENEVANEAMWDLMGKYMEKTEYKNVKILWVSAMGTHDIFNNKKPIKTLEDFKGLKFASQSPILANALETLGGISVFMPEPEIYTSLERGLVDGRTCGIQQAVVFRTPEVTKYRTRDVGLALSVGVTMMNLDTWNSLPTDIQKIIDEASGFEFCKSAGAIMGQAEIDYWKLIEEYDKNAGNPAAYYLPEDERARWMEVVQPVIDAWIEDMEDKGLPGKALVEDLRVSVKKYSQ